MNDQISTMKKENVFDTRRIHFCYLIILSKEKQNTQDDAAWTALQSTYSKVYCNCFEQKKRKILYD